MNAQAVRIRRLETTLLMTGEKLGKLQIEHEALRLAHEKLQERLIQQAAILDTLRKAGVIE